MDNNLPPIKVFAGEASHYLGESICKELGIELGKMKKDAVLVNVARGAVTDEQALCDAILEDKIGGLGVDVYSKEPFDEKHPFNKIMGMNNVILTPHIAWGAYESRVRCMEEIKENIKSFSLGEKRNRLV